jgi:hypothetical protein
MHLPIRRPQHSDPIVFGEGGCRAKRRLNVRYHDCCSEAFARSVSHRYGQAVMGQREKVIAIPAQFADLPAAGL